MEAKKVHKLLSLQSKTDKIMMHFAWCYKQYSLYMINLHIWVSFYNVWLIHGYFPRNWTLTFGAQCRGWYTSPNTLKIWIMHSSSPSYNENFSHAWGGWQEITLTPRVESHRNTFYLSLASLFYISIESYREVIHDHHMQVNTTVWGW